MQYYKNHKHKTILYEYNTNTVPHYTDAMQIRINIKCNAIQAQYKYDTYAMQTQIQYRDNTITMQTQ